MAAYDSKCIQCDAPWRLEFCLVYFTKSCWVQTEHTTAYDNGKTKPRGGDRVLRYDSLLRAAATLISGLRHVRKM